MKIDLGGNYTEVRATLTDVNGKLVVTKGFNQDQLIELNIDQPAGIYFLKITARDQSAVIRI